MVYNGARSFSVDSFLEIRIAKTSFKPILVLIPEEAIAIGIHTTEKIYSLKCTKLNIDTLKYIITLRENSTILA